MGFAGGVCEKKWLSKGSISQSVLFRVHEGVNIVSDFLLKFCGDSASYSIDEIIPFQELCNV